MSLEDIKRGNGEERRERERGGREGGRERGREREKGRRQENISQCAKSGALGALVIDTHKVDFEIHVTQ